MSSSTQAQVVTTTLISTTSDLQTYLNTLPPLIDQKMSLYIDLEGTKLSRHGSISLMTIYVPFSNTVYIIDVQTLGESAFTTTAGDSTTALRTVLEDESIPKVFFDVRNDNDALYAHFGIMLAGVHDLQLMELACRGNCGRNASREFVSGLGKAIKIDLPESIFSAQQKLEWQQNKARITALFAPTQGGIYEVFSERPLKPEIMKYCEMDFVLLPKLYAVYNKELSKMGNQFWQMQIEDGVKARLQLAKDPK
jgi:exonuclease 3'-5' domain-containing protein 1